MKTKLPTKVPVVALKRNGVLVCKACQYDFFESSAWSDPHNAREIMAEQGIEVLYAKDLKGDETCFRCGAKIKAD